MSRSARRRLARRRAVVLGGSVVVALGAATASADAATFTVTNGDDAGAGSLRDALTQAEATEEADDVVFSGVTGTITLVSPLPTIQRDTTITGPGADQLTITGVPTAPVLGFDERDEGPRGPKYATVQGAVSGVTLTGGSMGLDASGTDLTLRDVTLTGNGLGETQAAVGGLRVQVEFSKYGGGTPNGSADLDGVTITGNRGTATGGAALTGAEVHVADTDVLDNAAIAEDRSGQVGGLFVLSLQAPAVVEQTVVAGNLVQDGVAGLDVVPGDLLLRSERRRAPADDEVVLLSGTTVTGNSAQVAGNGGLVIAGDDSTTAVTRLQGVTVARNSSPSPAGLVVSAAQVRLADSALGGNRSLGFQDAGRDTDLEVSDEGQVTVTNSLVTKPGAGLDLGDGAIVGKDPGLLALGEYDGAGLSLPPGLGSPLLDAGDAGDQEQDGRGLTRTVDLDGVANAADATDIGAAEAQTAPTAAPEPPLAPTTEVANPTEAAPVDATATTQAPAPPPVVVQDGGTATTIPGVLVPRGLPFRAGNAFSLGKGRGKVQFVVPGTGEIAITGSGVQTVRSSYTARGVGALQVRLTRAQAKVLKKRGKLTKRLTLRFTPAAGAVETQHATLRFRQR